MGQRGVPIGLITSHTPVNHLCLFKRGVPIGLITSHTPVNHLFHGVKGCSHWSDYITYTCQSSLFIQKGCSHWSDFITYTCQSSFSWGKAVFPLGSVSEKDRLLSLLKTMARRAMISLRMVAVNLLARQSAVVTMKMRL